MFLGMKEGELTGLGESMRNCLALEWGELDFELLLGDFRFELGDFPGGIEDFRSEEEKGGDLVLAGGPLALGEDGLRKRAGTFLFLFPRSKSANTGSLIWSGLESSVFPIPWISLPCKLLMCVPRVSTLEVA